MTATEGINLANAVSAATNREGITRVACKSFRPIRWSKNDTKDTQNQSTEHNATYDILCTTDRENK